MVASLLVVGSKFYCCLVATLLVGLSDPCGRSATCYCCLGAAPRGSIIVVTHLSGLAREQPEVARNLLATDKLLLALVVNIFLVDLVSQEDQTVFGAELDDHAEGVVVEDLAGGVPGIDENESFYLLALFGRVVERTLELSLAHDPTSLLVEVVAGEVRLQ